MSLFSSGVKPRGPACRRKPGPVHHGFSWRLGGFVWGR